ncbi:cysteine hydrolase [bacterium]|nr:cysteine hydrolase [bacterium]MBT4552253.1 cysteine hydrolase [bacterium]
MLLLNNQKNTALLVIDMQKYFLDPASHAYISSATAIIPRIQKLIPQFETVIFTRHLNTKENAKNMSTWWRELLTKNNPLSELIPELDQSKALIMEKAQYDAFYETDLEKLLHTKGITQIYVTGVTTHLCCETTARAAFTRGFKVFFDAYATATYQEKYHQATLTNLAHGFATIVNRPLLTSPSPLVERGLGPALRSLKSVGGGEAL